MCPCRSTWPSWSAEKQRMWNQARRSRALSVLSAPRTNLTSPRKNSTRYKITNYLQLVLDQYQNFGLGFKVRKMILMTFFVFYRTWRRNRQTTAFPIWSPTWTARAARSRQHSTLWNSPARFSSTDSPPPLPASDQSGCVFLPHNTRPNCMDLKWKFSIATSIAISVSCYHS